MPDAALLFFHMKLQKSYTTNLTNTTNTTNLTNTTNTTNISDSTIEKKYICQNLKQILDKYKNNDMCNDIKLILRKCK